MPIRKNKYDYYKQRASDPKLTRKQRAYAENFIVGTMTDSIYLCGKSSINKTAFQRGNKWERELPEDFLF